MAIIPIKDVTSGPIKPEDIKSPSDYAQDAALRLVVQDAANADAFLSEKMWPLRWKEIDILYQSPRPISSWEGTNVAEANVTSFTIAKHVNSIVPQLVQGIFYENPPFVLRPRPGTDESVVRAKSAVFSSQLDEMKFEEQIEDGWFYTVLFGTAIYKWGWLTQKKKETRYVRKAAPRKVATTFGDVTIHTPESDEFVAKDIEKDVDRPELEHVPLNYIKVDPGLRKPDIREAKWVMHDTYMTFTDLQALRDIEGWKIPGDAELKSYFMPPEEEPLVASNQEGNGGNASVAHAAPRYDATTIDPLQKPLLVRERWDKDKVIAVLQDKLVIRNEANPFGVIPFYSSHWWRIPDSFYSLGVGHLVGQDQRVQQGLRNAALNLLGLACNPNYLRSRGANVPTQQIRQRRGGIIEVDGDVDKAFRILEVPKVPQEVWAALQSSTAESESTSGADQLLTQGDTSGPRSSMGRTAGGAAQLGAASATRLQGPVSRFISNVFVPWLYQMDELDKERLPMSTLRDILGDEIGPDFKVDEELYLNAKFEYEVLAGARLSAKRAMAASLPLLNSIFENPQILSQLEQTGEVVDVKELLAMYMEVSEWKNSRNLIRKLTPEEKQAKQAQNEAANKAAQQAQLENQKFQNKQQLNAQNNDARAVQQVAKLTLEHALESGQESLGSSSGA